MRDTILIVDDMEINRDMLEGILMDDYNILMAEDGVEAMYAIEKNKEQLACILLDLVMPKVDGYEVLSWLGENDYISTIPVLVISTEITLKSEKRCFDAGVSDFIHKPFDKDLVRTRVNNVVSLYRYKDHLEDKVARQSERIRKFNTNIIDMLGSVVETRSLESGTHVRRVKGYTRLLGKVLMKKYPEYNLTDDDIEIIVSASALHDVGKIAIPDSILLKPGKLTDEEFEKMKEHTTLGCEFIKNVENLWDADYGRVSYEIARHHHEKYDGKGYPDHLVGEDIPISAQLVSVADVYDALVSKRCYKEAYGKDTAFQMIMHGECGMFSPKMLDCLTECKEDFEKLANELAD